MNSDGTGQRRVAVRADDVFPVWSPDGARIAFVVRNARGYALTTGGSEGGDRRLIAQEGLDCLWPAWSPNGSQLAYTHNYHCEGDLDIFVVNADGSGRKQLTRDRRSSDAVWSPDGETLLFRRFFFPAGLFLLDLDTGRRSRVACARAAHTNG